MRATLAGPRGRPPARGRREPDARARLPRCSAARSRRSTTISPRGLRVAALGDLVDGFAARDEDDDAVLAAGDLRFGPPVLRPPSFRDFYAFEQHARTTWGRRGQEIPEPWYRLPVFYFSNVSELRGPGDPVWAPRGSLELDYEAEVGLLIDTPATDLPEERGEEAVGGLLVLNDWSARDLQRDETPVRLGPAKGKDFALSIGPWLVTPDELADRRADGGTAPDLAISATVRGADGTHDRDDARLPGHDPLLAGRARRPGIGGRPPAAGRAARHAGRWAAAACWRSARSGWAAGWSRATR